MVVQNLNEAYASIYAPREISEEVELAAHYFDSLGLNEEGIKIVIEQLGVEEFTDFVYDIAESYYLSEEEYKQGTLNLLTQKGTGRKRPTVGEPEDIRHTPSRSEEEPERPRRTSKGQLEIDFSAKKRSNAVAAAQENQPRRGRRGPLDSLAHTILQGMERHNKATKKLGKNVRDARRTAQRVGGHLSRDVAAPATRGVKQTVGFTRDLIKALTAEELEAWVNELINEGYDLSGYTWNEMAEIYMENVEQLYEGRRTSLRALAQESQRRKEDEERGRPEAEIETQGRLMLGPFRPSASQEERAAGGRERLRVRGKVPKKGGKDMFEHVLNHLISEGYANDVDSALVIMSNMSEEWRQSIVEDRKEIPNVRVRKKLRKLVGSDNPEHWERAGYISDTTGVPLPKH